MNDHAPLFSTVPEEIGLVLYALALITVACSALVADRQKGRRFAAVGLWLLVLLLFGFGVLLVTRIYMR